VGLHPESAQPVQGLPNRRPGASGHPLSETFYHAAWFGVLVILAWFVLPVLVGLVRFERADL